MKTAPLCAALAALLLCIHPARAQEAKPWEARLFKGPRYSNMLSITDGRLYVDFIVRGAWTVSAIRFEGKEVGQASGATGAVFQWEWNDPAIRPEELALAPLCKQLAAALKSETPTLGRKFAAQLPAGLQAALDAPPTDAAPAEGMKTELAAQLNAFLSKPDVVEELFLKSITDKTAALYAARNYKELLALREKGVVGAPIQRLNRKLAEAMLPGAIAELQRAIGTGHGGEAVRSVLLEIDGHPTPLVRDGKEVYALDAPLSGRRMTLTKRSVIGPFDHEAVFDFAPGAAGYLATHRFTVNADMARGHFAGYMYAFMHMMPESFRDFLVLLPDGREWAAENVDAAPGKQDNVLTERWKAMAAYSPAQKTGVAYLYPEAYEGSNHIYARGGKDKKYRAMLVKPEGWKEGDKLELVLRVTAFAAEPAEWKDRARAIMRDGK